MAHRIIEPEGLPPARGFSHAVAAEPGRTVWVAGQISVDEAGRLLGHTWVEQFDRALANVVTALTAAGASPQDVVAMEIFTVDVDAYRQSTRALGEPYRRHMGDHYPAMALLGVTELVEPDALLEITAVAVIPQSDDG